MRPVLIRTFITVLLSGVGLWAHGQAALQMPQTDDERLNQVRGLARNALRMGDTYTALFYFEEWARRKPDNTEVLHQLAELYRATRNYTLADTTYQRVLIQAADRYPEAYLSRAQMQMSRGKYVEAKRTLEQFRKVSRSLSDKSLGKWGLELMKGCDLALDLKDSAATATIALLDTSINWAHIEFSPAPMGDSVMVFGSLRENQVNFYDATEVDSARMPMRRLFRAVPKGDDWVFDGPFQGPWESMEGQIGGFALSPSGERVYFTVCKPDWTGKMICRIYMSDRNGSSWGEAIDLGDEVNHPRYTSSQPTVGRASKTNAEVVYFVSDRPEGKGGMDIWFTEYNPRKKQFREAKNAGAAINTAGMEFTPFYDIATHTLYFSTDSRPGLGGLDVFSMEGERSRWQKDSLHHMGKDINSEADDLWYSLRPDRKGGFVVSNREGGVALLHSTCCDDIYTFTFNSNIEIHADVKVTECGKDCLKGATLRLFMVDAETGEDYLAEERTVSGCQLDLQLTPNRDYRVEVTKDGWFNGTATLSTKGIRKSDTLQMDVCLRIIPTEPVRLEGIRYDFDSADLTTDAKTAIDTGLLVILARNPDIIIELSSHTDSRGKDDYNMRLSERRAQSVVKYCIDKGVDKRRLVAKGYGETRPIAPNERPDGTDDPDGRAMNRRTEFKIIGRLGDEDIGD